MTESHGVGQHPARVPIEVLLKDCLVRRTRHGGPGGQHRNKVETAIEIVHHPTGLVGFAAEKRSQEANRKEAIDRLRVLLAIRVRCVQSAEVQPSAMWQQRCRNQKIACSPNHEDFPAMLSEALDAVDAKSLDMPRAAAALGCSTSQLIRLIAKVPEALEWLNTQRQIHGMHKLHG